MQVQVGQATLGPCSRLICREPTHGKRYCLARRAPLNFRSIWVITRHGKNIRTIATASRHRGVLDPATPCGHYGAIRHGVVINVGNAPEGMSNAGKEGCRLPLGLGLDQAQSQQADSESQHYCKNND